MGRENEKTHSDRMEEISRGLVEQQSHQQQSSRQQSSQRKACWQKLRNCLPACSTGRKLCGTWCLAASAWYGVKLWKSYKDEDGWKIGTEPTTWFQGARWWLDLGLCVGA